MSLPSRSGIASPIVPLASTSGQIVKRQWTSPRVILSEWSADDTNKSPPTHGADVHLTFTETIGGS